MSKPKVKVNISCPHCSAGNVRDANNYHSILYKEYFKATDVIDFDDIKKKIDATVYPYSILADIYYYLTPFVCSECGKGVKVTNTYDRGNDMYATHPYKIEKAGKYLDYSFVHRFFKYLDTKARGVDSDIVRKKDDNGYDVRIPCQKEVFVKRVWSKIKHNIINKPFVIKIDGVREVVYIGYVDYRLGWGEEVRVYAYTLLGKPITFSLDHNSMKDFEYLEFPEDVAKQTMEFIKEM